MNPIDSLRLLESHLTRDELLGFLKGDFILRYYPLERAAAPVRQDATVGEISDALQKLKSSRS